MSTKHSTQSAHSTDAGTKYSGHNLNFYGIARKRGVNTPKLFGPQYPHCQPFNLKK